MERITAGPVEGVREAREAKRITRKALGRGKEARANNHRITKGL